MKILSLFIVVVAMTQVSSTAPDLNLMLDDAKKVQLEYESESNAAPQDSKVATRLRKEFQNANKQLIDYAKTHDDTKLKAIVLRINFYEKMLYELVDVEYGPDEEAKRKARAILNEYSAKVKKVAEIQSALESK